MPACVSFFYQTAALSACHPVCPSFFSTSRKNPSFLLFLILVWYEFTVQSYGGGREVGHIRPSHTSIHPWALCALFSPEESCWRDKLGAVTALVVNPGVLSRQRRRRTVTQKWKLSLQSWRTLWIQCACQKCNLHTPGQSNPLLKSYQSFCSSLQYFPGPLHVYQGLWRSNVRCSAWCNRNGMKQIIRY